MSILTTRVGTANFANVPDQGYDAAERNAIAVRRQALGIGSVTELWHTDSRKALFDVFDGDYRFGPRLPRTSALLFWDPDEWTGVRGGFILAHGVVAVRVGGRVRLISDPRPTPWELLRHNETDELVRAFASHWAPIRPALGGAAVAAGRRAHDTAQARTERLILRTGHAAVGMGDFNSTGKSFLGHDVGGRPAHYADLSSGIPDQVVSINGLHRSARLGPARYFHVPAGDHRRRHGGPPVGISTELTLAAA